MTSNIVVGMTGSSGQIYGIRALELLAETEWTTHLVVTESAKVTISHETDRSVDEIVDLADEVHSDDNIGAPPASGSFLNAGMLVAPCSMKTLSNIANGNTAALVTRAADVALKERRPLVVMPRKKPFNRIHLENMLALTDAGGIVIRLLLRPLFVPVYRVYKAKIRHISFRVLYFETTLATADCARSNRLP